MRGFLVLTLAAFAVSAHAAADILDTPEFAGSFPGDEQSPSATVEARSTDLVEYAPRGAGATSTALVAERQLPLVFLQAIYITYRAWSAFTWLVGLFGLATSSYGVYKDCSKQYDTTECLLASVGLVISAFGTAYNVKSGFSRVRRDGLESHGEWQDPDEPLLTADIHIPLNKRNIKHASTETENNGTWARHVTYYWDGEESHYLMYRRATAEDLGYENDGSIHHYRIQDSDEAKKQRTQVANGHPSLGKRLSKRSYGVVTDYLWKNGNYGAWNNMHQYADFRDMSRKVTSYLENNRQGVSCLTPIQQLGTHGGVSNTKIDNGIIAYGWNDQPYGFNGRAGAWVDRCRGSNF